MVEAIETDDAVSYRDLGLPISQAIVHDDTVYVAGIIGADPETGEIVSGGPETQAEQILENLAAILEAAGSSVDNVVKTTVLVEDIDEFPPVNELYADFFDEPYPARTTMEVSSLAGDFDVEIEAIAVR